MAAISSDSWNAESCSCNLNFTSMCSQSIIPKEVSHGCYHINIPTDIQFDKGEWKAIHTGLSLSSSEPLSMALNLLCDDLELLPGLSLENPSITEDGRSATVGCSENPRQLVLMARNLTDKMVTVHSSAPCFSITVDTINLWSCPKCKHGGDREHTRLPGKCKLAPKSGKPPDKPTANPKPAPAPL